MKNITTITLLFIVFSKVSAQTLPLNLNNSNWTNTNIIYSQKNTSCNSSGEISFENAFEEDYFYLKFDETPTTISFDYWKTTIATGSLKVQESADGKTWSDLFSTGSTKSSWKSYTKTLNSTTRFLHFRNTGTLKASMRNIIISKKSLTVSVTSLPAFITAINIPSETQTFEIDRYGLNNNITITSSTPEFIITPNELTNENGKATVSISFLSTSKGEKKGTLTIAETGNSSNQSTVSVSGFAAAAILESTTTQPFEVMEGKSISQQINITATNLEADVAISISGTNASYFTIDRSSISTSGTITVTYTPLSYGTHTALLSITSLYANTINIPLDGTSEKSPLNGQHSTLNINESLFNNNSIVSAKSQVSWNNNTIKTNNANFNNDGGSFIINLTGSSSLLTFEAQRGESGSNRQMKIEESTDGNSWSTLLTDDTPDTWKNYSLKLNPTTQQIRFSYKSDYNALLMRNFYWRNITIHKASIQATVTSLGTLTAEVGQRSEATFLIRGLNLTADLSVTSSDASTFKVSPAIVNIDDASPIYGYPITVAYEPTSTGSFEASIHITDSGNPDNTLPIEVRGETRPQQPIATDATQIMLTSCTANWQQAQHIQGYLISVMYEGVTLPEYDKRDIGPVPSFEITGLLPNTLYTYQVWSYGNMSLTSAEASNLITFKTLAQPTLTASTPTPFTTPRGTPFTQGITLSGDNLLDKINISITGTHASLFSVDKPDISSSGTVHITYSSSEPGIHSSILRISSLYAQTIDIELIGQSQPSKPTIQETTNITPVSFTASWAPSPGATSYRIWVTQGGNSIDQYNGKELGNVTSFEVTQLEPITEYSYHINASYETLTSAPSNALTVTTAPAPTIVHTPVGLFESTILKEVSQTINISGERLTRYVHAEIEGSSYFTINRNEIPTSGGSIIIYYLPLEGGTHNATITLSSPFATKKVLLLSGTSQVSTSASSNELATTMLYISTSKQIILNNTTPSTLSIYTLQGTLIRQYHAVQGTISLNELPSGSYVLKLNNDRTSPHTQKIMVK